MKIDVILSPRDLPALAGRDLHQSACVVFDILRATSTFVTALHNGAKEIVPVSEISEALAFKKTENRKQRAETILLGGERNGVRISAGGIDFDLGNSPREFTPEIVRGKTIVSTTTNGTRALRACAGAKMVLASSFLNLNATAEFLLSLANQDRHPQSPPSPPRSGGEGRGEVARFLNSPHPNPLPVRRGEGNNRELNVLLVCAGTGENPAEEDIIAAGALVDALAPGKDTHSTRSASAITARTAYFQAMQTGLEKQIGLSENGQRLLAMPELRADVAFCAQRDIFPLVAKLENNALIRVN